MAKKQELVVGHAGIVATPPALVEGERTGLEGLGKEDYKIPRIKLLQPLSPEIKSYQGKAIPGEFWHTGANKSLGSEFLMVPCVVGKRAVLWRPRDDGNGGILAFSKDAVNWDRGGNTTFDVELKGGIKVKWNTGKSVSSSGLLEFGSSNPADNNSSPAATLAYEYLVYLIDHPELSPCVYGIQRTGVNSAKQLNAHLAMTQRPTYRVAVRCFADEKTKGRNAWHVPAFDPAGYASDELVKRTKAIAENFASYETEIEQEDIAEPVKDAVDY